MTQTGYLQIDTTVLPTKSGEQIKPESPTVPSGGNDGPNNNATGNEATAKFQVGHTYQVPIAFMKHNSSEASMAAKYFGDTALVRPQANGTFQVSFAATSEGLNYISRSRTTAAPSPEAATSSRCPFRLPNATWSSPLRCPSP